MSPLETNKLIERQLEWKEAMKNILNDAAERRDCNAMDTYDRLVNAHKNIFKKDHDSHWIMGDSRDILNTYLLVRIFSMIVGKAQNEEL